MLAFAHRLRVPGRIVAESAAIDRLRQTDIDLPRFVPCNENGPCDRGVGTAGHPDGEVPLAIGKAREFVMAVRIGTCTCHGAARFMLYLDRRIRSRRAVRIQKYAPG